MFRGGYENIQKSSIAQISVQCVSFSSGLSSKSASDSIQLLIMNDTEYQHIALILYLHFWKVHQICMICKDFYLLQFSVFFGFDVLLVKMRLREMLQYKFDIFTTS